MFKHTKYDRHHHNSQVKITGEYRDVEFNFSEFNKDHAWVSILDDTSDRYVSTPLTLQALKDLRKAIDLEIKLLTEKMTEVDDE